ncbi:multidrug ABC transporter substrate-binding protein [Skermanella stibiiresistens SB22]|uniref:Multidrug ABC transporter substrate-binding protein n=1 Tax=Skermanella stibiiresistens SB22 TaxID=1385369 RepID=W9H6Q9_9PROT|nr:ABC transporter permease [Skermanella stibiiresistens]EWY40382.1 multidrug ABC transporter substrate-binding protein [Skermanella stibiiresistens SB22]
MNAMVLKTAIRALWLHRLRSLLTMTGIAVGIAAVILMVAIGTATQGQVIAQIQNLGANLIMVVPGQRIGPGGVRLSGDSNVLLTEEDGIAVGLEIPSVRAVSSMWWGSGQSINGNKNSWSRMHGITAQYLTIRDWPLIAGRDLSDEDNAAVAKVAILGQTVVGRLFEPGENPVGRMIRLRNVPFQVIGVLERKGQSSQGLDQDDVVYVPLATARMRLNNKPAPKVQAVSAITGKKRFDGTGTSGFQKVETLKANPSVVFAGAVNSLMIQARDTASLSATTAEIRELLRQRHRLMPDEPDDFDVRNLSEVAEARASSARMLTVLLIGIAGLSLLIAGIGIMNIMLVSVTERTAEIGLRLAVGAGRRDILSQFLIEAAALALVSGLLGVLLGFGGILAVDGLTEIAPVIDPLVALGAFLSAGAIGVVFGLYPAWQASKLDPIVALRRV